MYCYRRIVIDSDNQGHLEHSIEKNISDKLINCISNISIVCATCNDSYKKKGEKLRVPEKAAVRRFEEKICSKNCLKPCNEYEKLKKEYLKNQEAHIILQPSGVKGRDTNHDFN